MSPEDCKIMCEAIGDFRRGFDAEMRYLHIGLRKYRAILGGQKISGVSAIPFHRRIYRKSRAMTEHHTRKTRG